MDGMLRSSALIQLEMQRGFGTGQKWFQTIGLGMEKERDYIRSAANETEYLNRVMEVGLKIPPQLQREYYVAMTSLAEIGRVTAEDQKNVQKYFHGLSKEQGEDVEALDKSIKTLKWSWHGFTEGIEADLAPAITKLADTVREWLDGPAKEWIKTIEEWVSKNKDSISSIGDITTKLAGLTAGVWLAVAAFKALKWASPYGLVAGTIAGAKIARDAIKDEDVKGEGLGAHLEGGKDAVGGKGIGGSGWFGKDSAVGIGIGNIQQWWRGGNDKDKPHMATGGVVTGPTNALIGEGGPEAVIPLKDWFGGSGGQKTGATETTAQRMLSTLEHIEEIWRRFSGGGAGGGGGASGSWGGRGGDGKGGSGIGMGGRAAVGGAGGGQPGKGEYNVKKAYDLIKAAGGTDEEARNLAAISQPESGGNPRSHNTNASTGDNSYGLWQINMLGPLEAERLKQYGLKNKEELFDPATNARVALQMSRTNHGYRDWSTYNKGLHTKYLGGAGPSGETPKSPPSVDHPISGKMSDIKPGTPSAASSSILGKENDAPSFAETMRGRSPPDSDLRAYMSGQHVGNAPWCAAFVNASLDHAGMKGTGSNFAKSFMTWGRHVDAKDVQRGDVAVMNRGGSAPTGSSTSPGHVGLVTGTMKDGRVPTIEGNKSHTVKNTSESANIEYRRYDGTTGKHDAPGAPSALMARAGGGANIRGAMSDMGGGGGAAGGCAGAMSSAAGALGDKGILGALFGGQGMESVLGGMLGGMKGGAGGILGSLLGNAGGAGGGGAGGLGGIVQSMMSGGKGGGGFLGGAMGKVMAGAMNHKVEGAANLDVNFKGLPKGTNIASSFEGLFKNMNINSAPSIPWAKNH